LLRLVATGPRLISAASREFLAALQSGYAP
jgi:hypothetical protein